MRIVIDMQGAQSGSRFRGIGRYTLAFAQGVVRNRGEHEIILALSGLFPDSIEPIRAAFDGLLTQENIRVWHAPGPVSEKEPGNEARREVAELMREAFLASLCPDLIHVSSLFEGYVDDAVTSIGKLDKLTPVSVTLFDLIPLLNSEQYLKPDSRYEQYYRRKLNYLQRAQKLLAISDSTRREGVTHLGLAESKISNVLAAIEHDFHDLGLSNESAQLFLKRLNISRPFILYTGATDERKNIPRLIKAFARLPSYLRKSYQLVLAGGLPNEHFVALQRSAKELGIRGEDIVFTQRISDEELVCLYKRCHLYVFPSWHEGFGLPVLEAMACGAPVVCSRTSSMPEVIGLEAGMFDPFDIDSIANKIQLALLDDGFRDRLRVHGQEQARRFSWNKTAKLAIAAWESTQLCVSKKYFESFSADNRLYTAISSVLTDHADEQLLPIAACLAQNKQAGVERQLLVDISELSNNSRPVNDAHSLKLGYLKGLLDTPPKGFRVVPVCAMKGGSYYYARTNLKRLSNGCNEALSLIPKEEPIRWQRGDIFFGLDVDHQTCIENSEFYRKLRIEGVTVKFLVCDFMLPHSDGLCSDATTGGVRKELLALIAQSDGSICVSKATSDSFMKWIEQSNASVSPNFESAWIQPNVDELESSRSEGNSSDVAMLLRAISQRPSFLSFAAIDPRHGVQRALEAVELLWASGFDVNLVLIGQQGCEDDDLFESVTEHVEDGLRLFWLEDINDDTLGKIYAANICLVVASISENSDLSLVEAARYQAPVVARDVPSVRDMVGDAALYFEGDTVDALTQALMIWLELHAQGAKSQSENISFLAREQSTERLKDALTKQNYPRKQLLVDISELVQRDAKTGIQRVVRSLLHQWLLQPPQGYRVEPVYATDVEQYRYARKFMSNIVESDCSNLVDEVIDIASGDVFLGLDLAPAVVPAHVESYRYFRRNGVQVAFVVYDLLPLMDGYFERVHADACARWLDVVSEMDVAVCISESVASEFKAWVAGNKPSGITNIRVSSFHLGADIEGSMPSEGVPDTERHLLEQINAKRSFLQVSTLAPHKGHAQVLDAFQLLWQEGIDINLVIVGKQGWLVDELVERLRNHYELNKHLFWLEGISDEYLEKIYANSSCLIAASYGEGFGLPLIEAAQNKLPIIVRDIPVFREVAGEHAYYFQAKEPIELARVIKSWLSLYEQKRHPTSENMPWLTWKESAAQLLKALNLPC